MCLPKLESQLTPEQFAEILCLDLISDASVTSNALSSHNSLNTNATQSASATTAATSVATPANIRMVAQAIQQQVDDYRHYYRRIVGSGETDRHAYARETEALTQQGREYRILIKVPSRTHTRTCSLYFAHSCHCLH